MRIFLLFEESNILNVNLLEGINYQLGNQLENIVVNYKHFAIKLRIL